MTADRRSHVEKRLGELLEYMGNDDSVKLCTKYRRDLLIRSTYEYSLSDTSKDKFLRYFFKYIELDMDDTEDIELDTDLLETLKSFADFLVDNFYLPRQFYV